MKLKTTILLLIITVCSIKMNAQNCKYDFDKEDPMTNERVRRNSYKLKPFFTLSMYRKANENRIEVNVALAGEQNYRVEKEDKIFIKLGDDSLLTLTTADVANPVSYVQGYQVATNYAISYNISKEDVEKISKSGIAVTRLKLAEQEMTIESSKREIRKTAEGASCMLVD